MAATTMDMMAMGGKKRYTHMTFFWGVNSEILFEMWPGTSRGHYALALIVCFFMTLLLEWVSYLRITRPGWSHGAISATRTAMYTFRIGLAYLVMLAIMSFNGGVFIVILAAHSLGFALFGCKKVKEEDSSCCASKPDLPVAACC